MPVHPPTEPPALRPGLRACLFDMDGVLTQTAVVHAAAWKATFDAFLTARAHSDGSRFVPFDPDADYGRYVDGKPRADGVRDFLAARGITLPAGAPDDAPGAPTVQGLGAAKNDRVLALIREQGVAPYPDAVTLVHAVLAAGLRVAVVSSSANTRDVLASAGLGDLFATIVDGNTIAERGLPGKPAPDAFLAAAEALGVPAAEAAVFEDALSGVEAGRAGHFGQVIGVDRVDHAQALLDHGADVVVQDLAELAPGGGAA